TVEQEIVLTKPAKVELIEEKIVLPEPIHFAFDSAQIEEKSFGILDQIVSILNKKDDGSVLTIDGHTDSIGSDAYNSNLSKRRAASVVKYLTDKGIPAARLVSNGYGESRPVATNETEGGRAENRRVEFNFQTKEPE